MSDPTDVPDQVPATPGAAGRAVLPRKPIGWWALGLAVAAMASWVVLPLITTTFRETYPITNTWVMPAIGIVLLDAAAVLSVLCVWRWRERSVLNIVALALTLPMALLFTLIVVGEGLAGA